MITSGKNLPKTTVEILEDARLIFIRGKGRPTKFNPESAAEICTRIEEGETLKRICLDENMPHRATVNDWKRSISHFGDMLTRARLAQGAALADDAVAILDEMHGDKDLNLTAVRVGEVRAKMRLELAKCMDRDTYGDKRQISADVNIQNTVGGIIDLVMGKTKPLVSLDVEAEDVFRLKE